MLWYLNQQKSSMTNLDLINLCSDTYSFFYVSLNVCHWNFQYACSLVNINPICCLQWRLSSWDRCLFLQKYTGIHTFPSLDSVRKRSKLTRMIICRLPDHLYITRLLSVVFKASLKCRNVPLLILNEQFPVNPARIPQCKISASCVWAHPLCTQHV